MKLIPTTAADVDQLMTWFHSEKQLVQWSGTGFAYPYNKTTFIDASKVAEHASFSLHNEQHELIAFGQYYQRLHCVHLARIIVNPVWRGQGMAAILLNLLSLQGKKALALNAISLFVLADNKKAIQVYQSNGFTLQHYPENIDLISDCLYMVKDR